MLALQTAEATRCTFENAFKSQPGVHPDALSFRGFHLPGVRGHLVARFQARQVDFNPQPYRSAGAVDGNVTAAQHQHPRPKRLTIWCAYRAISTQFIAVQADIFQEMGVDDHTG